MPEAAGDLVRRNVSVIFAAEPAAVAVPGTQRPAFLSLALDLESDPPCERDTSRVLRARAAILRECFLISRS